MRVVDFNEYFMQAVRFDGCIPDPLKWIGVIASDKDRVYAEIGSYRLSARFGA